MENSFEKYISYLTDGGAFVAREIAPADIVCAPWPVMKCRYGCPRYGKNRSCPPFAPDYRHTREILASFSKALIFGTHRMDAGTPLAVECARMLARDGFYKAMAFGTGPCTRCEVCTPDSCPSPAEVAPSPEACGIDLIATVRNAGLPISAAPAPGEPLNCYALVLVE